MFEGKLSFLAHVFAKLFLNYFEQLSTSVGLPPISDRNLPAPYLSSWQLFLFSPFQMQFYEPLQLLFHEATAFVSEMIPPHLQKTFAF